MPFRERQVFVTHSSRPVMELEEVTLETGRIVKRSVNQCKKKMPDPALFDLADNIKANVNLQEVSAKVLGSGSVDGDAVVNKLTDELELNKQTNKE